MNALQGMYALLDPLSIIPVTEPREKCVQLGVSVNREQPSKCPVWMEAISPILNNQPARTVQLDLSAKIASS